MLTKYKEARPKKGANKPFVMFSCLGRIEKFFSGRGHPISTYFLAQFFGRTILKYIENNNGFR